MNPALAVPSREPGVRRPSRSAPRYRDPVVIVAGAALGMIVLLARRSLWRTVTRALALLLVLAIATRLIYGWWHATHPGSSVPAGQHPWMTASFTQLSLAVAAGLIGYYLIYAIGVRLRLSRHERRRSL